MRQNQKTRLRPLKCSIRKGLQQSSKTELATLEAVVPQTLAADVSGYHPKIAKLNIFHEFGCFIHSFFHGAPGRNLSDF